MERKVEIWVVMKLGELKTDRVLTMDDLAEIEADRPIMIGSTIPDWRFEQLRRRKHVKRHRTVKHGRRGAARKR